MIKWFAKKDNFNKAIREISFNITEGNIYLPQIVKRKLKKHRQLISKLAGAATTKNRQRLVNQSGGYLNILLPAILGLVSALR